MQIGEIWEANGIWDHEPKALVRIEEILESGSVDVNYQLDPSKPQDMRILPRQYLIRRVDDE